GRAQYVLMRGCHLKTIRNGQTRSGLFFVGAVCRHIKTGGRCCLKRWASAHQSIKASNAV
ncbi:hypothetical protein, partial [Neisseria lactamica]|uniref:hypothetical protein n=1 Tax=Neisseria lactamica TaxID=486 RepID=UPI0027E0A615